MVQVDIFPLPAIRIIRENGQYVLDDYNRLMEELTRGRIGKFSKRPIEDIYGNIPEIAHHFKQLNTNNRQIDFTLYYCNRDMAIHDWVRFHMRFIKDDCVVIFLEIITDSVNNNIELRSRQNYFEAIQDTQTEYVCYYLPDGTITYANPAFCGFVNRSLTNIVGESIFLILAEDQVEKADSFKNAVNRMDTYNVSIHEFKTTNHAVHYVRWTDRKIFELEGLVVVYKGIGIDVTLEYEMALELEVKNRKLEAINHYNNLLIDVSGRFLEAHEFPFLLDEVCRRVIVEVDIDYIVLYNYQPAEKQFLRLDFWSANQNQDYFPPYRLEGVDENAGRWVDSVRNDNYSRAMSASNANSSFSNYFRDFEIVSSPVFFQGNSSVFFLFLRAKPKIWTEEEISMIATLANIVSSAWNRHNATVLLIETQKKQMESVKLLDESNRLSSIGIITAGITHEINQPLNNIRLAAENLIFMLNQKSDELENYLPEKLHRIIHNMGRIDQIIRHLRSFIVDEHSQSQRIDLNQSVLDAVQLVEKQLVIHYVTKTLVLEQSFPLIIKANPINIEQIVINLVNNALQALNKSNTLVRRIAIVTRIEKQQAILEIADNGGGILPKLSEKIFKPFFSTNSKNKNMGLGLAIVKQYVDRYDGMISIHNNDQGGATFTIRFPLAK